MSKLGFINYYILQWLFIRLARYSGLKEKGWMLLIGVMPTSGYGKPLVGPIFTLKMTTKET